MRVISINLNGIRSAAQKGIGEWLQQTRPDIVCCQEVRARENDIPQTMRAFGGLRGYFAPAQKPGYAGTALYCRRRPLAIDRHFGHPVIDSEGRYICAEFDNCRIVSFYMPSGSSGDVRLQVKMKVMKALQTRMKNWAQSANDGKQTLLCGDINIAHTCKDLHNWRSNQKNSGFLPQERKWLDMIIDKLGWRDVFRLLNDSGGEYTWWSNRGQARQKNVGWRLDYHLATAQLAQLARQTAIYRDKRFSDHAPVCVRYHFALR